MTKQDSPRRFDRISTEIPHIAKVSPASTEKDCEDLYKGGGIPFVFQRMLGHIHTDVMTVDAQTLKDKRIR